MPSCEYRFYVRYDALVLMVHCLERCFFYSTSIECFPLLCPGPSEPTLGINTVFMSMLKPYSSLYSPDGSSSKVCVTTGTMRLSLFTMATLPGGTGFDELNRWTARKPLKLLMSR